MLFYDSATGSAAIDFDPTAVLFPAGAFSTGWTHVAVGPNVGGGQDALLFYNASLRSGALGLLGPDGFTTIRSWEPEAFGAWTLVIGTDTGWLFYNGETGSAAIGALQNGDFATTAVFPAGGFATGWTHIVHADLAISDMQGCCWPISVRPGEAIEFRTSTGAPSFEASYRQYLARPAEEVGVAEIENSEELVPVKPDPAEGPTSRPGVLQAASDQTPDVGCESWEPTFPLTVPETWESGFYVARLEDSRGSTSFVPFVIQPAVGSPAPIALIANLSTWCVDRHRGGSRFRYRSIRATAGLTTPCSTSTFLFDKKRRLFFLYAGKPSQLLPESLRERGY